ncbi:MAG: nuclear transport factor 2 family protein [Nocardiaceae bacterium]|nr:nuclear transport factor 2 family protein [Nocardiaceae bacterium]
MPHVTIRALENQLAGAEERLIAGITEALASVYGERIRPSVVVQLVGREPNRWAVGGSTRDEVAPLVTFATREAALTRPGGHQVAARLSTALTGAVVAVLGEQHRAGIVLDVVTRRDDRVAIGGNLVGEASGDTRDELRDHVEIESLRAEFTDAAMMNDHDRLASLFVADGVLRIPDADIEAVGAEAIRALAVHRAATMEVFVQTTHPGVTTLDGDTATGRAYVSELIKTRDHGSLLNYAIYHDRYQRVSGTWLFAERSYEIRYFDQSPLSGGLPDPRTALGDVRG